MGYLLNGVTDAGLPMHLLEALMRDQQIPYFVETGTAGGESIKAVAHLFEHCYTIEIIEGRPLDLGLENVTYFTGNSVDILPDIIKNFTDEYVLFWLDAHYSDPVPNTSGVKECPVMEEIDVISKYKNALILIDDLRHFLGMIPYPNDPRDWPGIADIIVKLKTLFPEHYTTITDDYVVCVPMIFKYALDDEWRGRFHVRYPSTEDKLKQSTKEVYNALKKFVE